jgi:hypothetical protein
MLTPKVLKNSLAVDIIRQEIEEKQKKLNLLKEQ